MTDTIPQRLFDKARTTPAAPAYYVRQHGIWVPTGYRLFADEVKRAGKALMALGLGSGSTVTILGANRPEWTIVDLATMAVGGAAAGIYASSSPSEVAYIANHTASPVLVVDSAAQWQKVQKERANLPHLRWVVTMKGVALDEEFAPEKGLAIDQEAPTERSGQPSAGPQTLSWDTFLAKGAATSDDAFFARLDALEPRGLATLIYTSGTTGPPKGVMLSHENIAVGGTLVVDIAKLTAADRSLSYLPLSHVAEQLFTLYGPISAGSAVYFAESVDKVPDNLREVRPTLFFGVPRIWEKFHAGIAAKVAATEGAKKRIAAWAMSTGSRASALTMRGKPLPASLGLQYRLAHKLFFSKVKEAIGLDAGRVFISGAAPIAREVLEFLASLDIVVSEGYGMSENTGGTTINWPGRVKLGSVGSLLPDTDVRIEDDGEISMRGPGVFLGYYKDAAATAEALVDGWLRTGDLGAVDAEGFLSITGRKKDLIITAGGKNVAPTNIESALKNHPLVGEAVVIGDRRKHLTVLVVLDLAAARTFVDERGAEADRPLHTAPAVLDEVQRALDAVNVDLARVEQVKKFVILPAPFSIETGELTPTLKVKRRVVEQKFSAEIESMYRD